LYVRLLAFSAVLGSKYSKKSNFLHVFVRQLDHNMSAASPTASATASATATASVLPKSGGSPLVGTVTLLASLALISSGVGVLLLMRRSVS
jgi:hypothetical protein